MRQIPDDYIIQSMERTGYPPWMQEEFPDVVVDEVETLTESETAVLDLLKFGKDQAITRKELMRQTGMGDRCIRNIIEKLRADYIIINDQDGKGYYRPTDKEDVRRWYHQEMARAMSKMSGLRLARYSLKREGLL